MPSCSRGTSKVTVTREFGHRLQALLHGELRRPPRQRDAAAAMAVVVRQQLVAEALDLDAEAGGALEGREGPWANALFASGRRLRLSPVSLLEIRFLVEVGGLRLVRGRGVAEITDDPRWQLDSPSAARLFTAALDVDWTRDPFDRLLVAHASYRRWRLATGDRFLIEQLREDDALPL